ncbi:hypothetical protein OEZ85_003260 [Tetradesmus obliquus]|uniref:IPT/TIG domain-containing protein n=1 Tax=Tetradesmus obliquus TaxID=3088 RepID=A0ABY8U473_TETOB|nr:hypothetical protein OEZ85_003260 [Tetradesmus obliquus]
MQLLLPRGFHLVGGRCIYNNAGFIPGTTHLCADSNSVTCVVAHTVDGSDEARGVIEGGPVAVTYGVPNQAISAVVQGCILPDSNEYGGLQIESVSTTSSTSNTNCIPVAAASQAHGCLPKLHTHVTYNAEIINGLVAMPAGSTFTFRPTVHYKNLVCKDAGSHVVEHSGQPWTHGFAAGARISCSFDVQVTVAHQSAGRIAPFTITALVSGTNGLQISTFSSTAVKVASGIHLSAAAVFDATAPFLPVPGATITGGKLPRQNGQIPAFTVDAVLETVPADESLAIESITVPPVPVSTGATLAVTGPILRATQDSKSPAVYTGVPVLGSLLDYTITLTNGKVAVPPYSSLDITLSHPHVGNISCVQPIPMRLAVGLLLGCSHCSFGGHVCAGRQSGPQMLGFTRLPAATCSDAGLHKTTCSDL